MKHERLHSIIQFIEKNWRASGAWPGYIRVMRQVVLSGQEEVGAGDTASSATQNDPTDWIELQALCCQAAGGDPARTTPATAAWYLLYAAASLFDHLEDQDELPAALAGCSPGELINAATGLLFSACLALDDLFTDAYPEDVPRIARQISRDFTSSVLRVAGGQQRDLLTAEPTIEDWLAIAKEKSGSVFALACRSGARWGTADPVRIGHFGCFGNQLGLILQLRDDISDLSPALLSGKRPAEFGRSLAAAYARSVLPPDGKAQLSRLIQALPADSGAANDLVALLDSCGTALYLQAEVERQRGKALAALRAADPAQPARDALRGLLHGLVEF